MYLLMCKIKYIIKINKFISYSFENIHGIPKSNYFNNRNHNKNKSNLKVITIYIIRKYVFT